MEMRVVVSALDKEGEWARKGSLFIRANFIQLFDSSNHEYVQC